jgi:hypothetical protein
LDCFIYSFVTLFVAWQRWEERAWRNFHSVNLTRDVSCVGKIERKKERTDALRPIVYGEESESFFFPRRQSTILIVRHRSEPDEKPMMILRMITLGMKSPS